MEIASMKNILKKFGSLALASIAFSLSAFGTARADDNSRYASLVQQTRLVDSTAQAGRWRDAQKDCTRLLNMWAHERNRMHGVQAQNDSQKFDASLKWLLGAVREHEKNQVHTSAIYLEGSLQHMMGQPARP
jgi:hypothetical protein